jgi:hypothetical protein
MFQVLAPTDGQVLTYDTVNGWQPEDSQGGEEYTISEISTNTTAQVNFLYVLTANLTLTLPATPSVGDRVALSNMSGTTTPTVARNGNLIAGLAEDLTIDVLNLSVEFIYSGASQGWIIFVDSILGTSGGGGSVDGNGTTNYISKWSDANTLTDSVIFEDANGNLGIGTTNIPNNLNGCVSNVGEYHFTSDGRNIRWNSYYELPNAQPSYYQNGYGFLMGLTGGGDFVFMNAPNNTSGADAAQSVTERMRILAGGGLTFNGDTAAANALDDYEEGTWTMGIAFRVASCWCYLHSEYRSHTQK